MQGKVLPLASSNLACRLKSPQSPRLPSLTLSSGRWLSCVCILSSCAAPWRPSPGSKVSPGSKSSQGSRLGDPLGLTIFVSLFSAITVLCLHLMSNDLKAIFFFFIFFYYLRQESKSSLYYPILAQSRILIFLLDFLLCNKFMESDSWQRQVVHFKHMFCR